MVSRSGLGALSSGPWAQNSELWALGSWLWALGRGWVTVSVEGGLHPPQLLLDLARLRLAGLLQVRVSLRGREADVSGGELGDAALKVRLQLPVGAVREGSILEGVDLTHNLGDVPGSRGTGREEKQK